MKTLAGFAAIVWLATGCPAQDIATRADEYIAEHVKQGRFSGSVLIARDGKILLSKGYGWANVEHEIPNAPRTKFRLGSITKQFTATAVLLLQARGKLSVEDPVHKYLTDSPEAWRAITIHHLLTHTSGIPSYTGMPDYRKRMREPVTVPDMIARFRDKPLEFTPGEKFAYNNSGYFLLGALIEKISGVSYETFLKQNIFDPLGMKDSGYDYPRTILKHRASGYELASNGVINAAFLDMSQPYAAGSLYSTVEDLYLWDQALYTEKLLPKKTLDAMFTPFKNGYAYGWNVEKASGRTSIGHGGGINGFSTMILRFPEERVCVIVLGNMESPAPFRMARAMSAMVFGEKYEPAP